MQISPTSRRFLALLTSCALTATSVLAGATAAGAASEATGEPFFPRSGNSGYNVSHYEVHLGYAPRSGVLHARDTIEARATANLKRFTLDLDGLKVSSVSIDGEAAAVGRGRGKIKIRPAQEIEAESKFTVDVRYAGVPRKVTDPDGSTEGWYRTRDGAVGVGEPVGTAAWLACNNTLRDKATFSVSIAVPRGLKAVSNGRLMKIGRLDGRRDFFWQEHRPMVPYLALVDIGKGKLEHGHIGKLPTWTLVDPSLLAKSQPALNSLPEAIRFEENLFGPYPFDAAGSVVDAADLGYALETQTRPIYAGAPDRTTLVHETAHQWFGDSVGLERWPNIWLNEGLATWTEWYFAERHGGQTAAEVFAKLYKRPASQTKFWNPPSGHPGQAKNLFVTSTYVRGAMTIEALRQEVGTRDVLKLLRRWATERRYGHGDIADFVALASEVSGRDLGPFFHRWLFQRGKPAL